MVSVKVTQPVGLMANTKTSFVSPTATILRPSGLTDVWFTGVFRLMRSTNFISGVEEVPSPSFHSFVTSVLPHRFGKCRSYR